MTTEEEHKSYEGQTHLLSIPLENAVRDLPVVCIEKIISDIKNDNLENNIDIGIETPNWEEE